MTERSWTRWVRGYKVLLSFSFRVAPWQAALFLLCGVIMALSGPVLSVGAKLLVDAATRHNLSAGLWATGLLAGISAAGLVSALYYIDLLFLVVEKAGAALDRRLMELMGGSTGLAHHEWPEYLNRLEVLREERGQLAFMTNATAGLLRVAVQLVSSAVLLAHLQSILLLLPLVGVISFGVGSRARRLQRQATEASAEMERLRKHLFMQATSSGAGKEVRIFGLAGVLLDRHHGVSDEIIRMRNRAEWRSAWLQAIDAAIYGLAYIGAIALVLNRALSGAATPGDVVLAVGLVASMNNIVYTAVFYGTHAADVLRVAGYYLWLEDYARTTESSPAQPVAVPVQLHDGITLCNVSFRYPDTARTILDGVSLHLPAGAVVALVGENGAGKTTLAKLLCRFYQPDEGEILVDGIDVRRFGVAAWRACISAAFQDFARFELVLRETVGIGHLERLEDRAAVTAALQRGGAADIPARLPGGLETQLGKAWDGGVDLSGGQWQKLALSRAMMRPDPLLVIFDEPTAALDAQTEHLLFERVAAAAHAGEHSGTITVLVTHRFSTVQMADLIVVLEQGRIVEQGNHHDLMRRNGLYAELYRLQSAPYQLSRMP